MSAFFVETKVWNRKERFRLRRNGSGGDGRTSGQLRENDVEGG